MGAERVHRRTGFYVLRVVELCFIQQVDEVPAKLLIWPDKQCCKCFLVGKLK